MPVPVSPAQPADSRPFALDPGQLADWARQCAPACDFWSIRAVDERSEQLMVRQDVAHAPGRSRDRGLMVAVSRHGALAYAASGDVSAAGLRAAFGRAADLAGQLAGRFDAIDRLEPATVGHYASEVGQAAPDSLAERIDVVRDACASLHPDSRIVDWHAALSITSCDSLFLTSEGSRIAQRFHFVVPNLQAVAHVGGQTQTRTSAGQYNGYCRQGGWEILDVAGFRDEGARIAAEAIELTMAPNCPQDTMDLLLMPDQMMLQIHESIGHPLELDRILGDERNFAGTSFVSLDMFGHYRYGSDLLNVSYAPDVPGQFASFGFDDAGSPARRTMLIENGILKRPLGGAASTARARLQRPDIESVATTRACSWNRAPIDRMSNLNIEPGASTLDQMIAATERGVLMQTNCSWSIDDSRNKFQFGCEHGRMIRGGRLAEVVRNPNYRGVSATFWRSLAMVGNADSFAVMGTPFCGKGEPMQVIRVGHASPPCRFTQVQVFGGGA